MLPLLLVEDNPSLRDALVRGLEATDKVQVVKACASAEAALDFLLADLYSQVKSNEQKVATTTHAIGLPPAQVVLMDVQLAGEMDGIQAAVAIRRELPRFPVVFYSIQDDERYYRQFLRSGILSHYAYVRKSNYLLPEMILPLLRDAVAGSSFIDSDIAMRVEDVRHKDETSPMSLLEPNEQVVAHMLAEGLTNEQIAERLGFRDKRTVSRTNGQIYTAWRLNSTPTDEKVARTRAAIIVQTGRLLVWDQHGIPYVMDKRGQWVEWKGR